MNRIKWHRGSEDKYGRMIHRSKCGKYTITRREWCMPISSISYELVGAGGKKGLIDLETLKEAKEAR
jgi:hypothetical protein